MELPPAEPDRENCTPVGMLPICPFDWTKFPAMICKFQRQASASNSVRRGHVTAETSAQYCACNPVAGDKFDKISSRPEPFLLKAAHNLLLDVAKIERAEDDIRLGWTVRE